MTTATEHILGPTEGRYVQILGLGVRHMIESARTGGSFALVEHPIAPLALASPLHMHTREDEYSYVLEGTIGLQVGEEVIEAHTGDLVFKPRDVPHAFWNAADEPARVLEIIAPAQFATYFDEIAPLLDPSGPPDLAGLVPIAERYGLELDPDSIPVLVERHGLRMSF